VITPHLHLPKLVLPFEAQHVKFQDFDQTSENGDVSQTFHYHESISLQYFAQLMIHLLGIRTRVDLTLPPR
jgi:hypothetical protein